MSKKTFPSKIGTNTPVESCVIFVHGFAGSISTWDMFSNHLVNQWTSPDSFGLEYDIHTIESTLPILGFAKRFLFGGPGIEILANSFNTTINEVCKEYKNVIIVAHSMGGLIARQYLVDVVKKTKEVGKIRALITYATPHKGSKIASLTKSLGLIYYNFPFYFIREQVVQMCRTDSEFIIKLNKDWDSLLIEKKIDFKRVIGERDFVVDRESAALNFSLYDSIANKGHLNIIKPTRPKDPAFLVTFNYLKDFRSKLEKSKEIEELNELTAEEESDE
jgi:hypothetical protein